MKLLTQRSSDILLRKSLESRIAALEVRAGGAFTVYRKGRFVKTDDVGIGLRSSHYVDNEGRFYSTPGYAQHEALQKELGIPDYAAARSRGLTRVSHDGDRLYYNPHSKTSPAAKRAIHDAAIFSNRTLTRDDGSQAKTEYEPVSARDKSPAHPPISVHELTQNTAQAAYQRVVNRWVSAAELHIQKKHKAMEDLLLLWLMLMDEEETEQFQAGSTTLSHGGTPPTLEEAKAFAFGRTLLLKDFAQAAQDKLEEAYRMGGKKALRQVAEELEAGAGGRVAATEAQATYGAAQLRQLQEAGFKTKAWVTVGDDRVRDSHNMCEEQGAIPLDNVFHNGLKYPGDPVGPPEEVCNCRCWLVGVDRA